MYIYNNISVYNYPNMIDIYLVQQLFTSIISTPDNKDIISIRINYILNGIFSCFSV